jgi:hypothetical protein
MSHGKDFFGKKKKNTLAVNSKYVWMHIIFPMWCGVYIIFPISFRVFVNNLQFK